MRRRLLLCTACRAQLLLGWLNSVCCEALGRRQSSTRAVCADAHASRQPVCMRLILGAVTLLPAQVCSCVSVCGVAVHVDTCCRLWASIDAAATACVKAEVVEVAVWILACVPVKLLKVCAGCPLPQGVSVLLLAIVMVACGCLCAWW